MLLVLSAPALTGLLLRAERAKGVALFAAAQAQAAEAAGAERIQMSAEVHDIVAHHLSSIVLLTRAAATLIDDDPAETRALIDAASTEADEALDDLRQLLRAVRFGDPAVTVPKPTLSDLPGLLDSVRHQYPNVTVKIDPAVPAMDPVRSLACFRIIQESLTNARKHAPGSMASARVRAVNGIVHIDVDNGPSMESPLISPSGDGLGLRGMRERAEALGGSLSHGRTPNGGWHVGAAIPAWGG